MALTDTSPAVITLWRDSLKLAEHRCGVTLSSDIESYLITLLVRFSSQPDIASRVMATEFLQALQERELMRHYSLANVGDQCLLLSGLFPRIAERRLVSLRYFVDLGRSAYANISSATSNIYALLAAQFVLLMDVLQSLNERNILLPIEAYDQWQSLGSRRALTILQGYRLSK